MLVVLCVAGCGMFQAASEQRSAYYVEGELLVKFTPEAAQAIERARQEGRVSPAGLASLEQLFAEHHVSGIEPVFAGPHDPEQIKTKFPARATRISPGAQLPSLMGVYKLMIEGDAAAAAVAFQHDPAVEYAQPNYLATSQSEQKARP